MNCFWIPFRWKERKRTSIKAIGFVNKKKKKLSFVIIIFIYIWDNSYLDNLLFSLIWNIWIVLWSDVRANKLASGLKERLCIFADFDPLLNSSINSFVSKSNTLIIVPFCDATAIFVPNWSMAIFAIGDPVALISDVVTLCL